MGGGGDREKGETEKKQNRSLRFSESGSNQTEICQTKPRFSMCEVEVTWQFNAL